MYAILDANNFYLFIHNLKPKTKQQWKQQLNQPTKCSIAQKQRSKKSNCGSRTAGPSPGSRRSRPIANRISKKPLASMDCATQNSANACSQESRMQQSHFIRIWKCRRTNFQASKDSTKRSRADALSQAWPADTSTNTACARIRIQARRR